MLVEVVLDPAGAGEAPDPVDELGTEEYKVESLVNRIRFRAHTGNRNRAAELGLVDMEGLPLDFPAPSPGSTFSAHVASLSVSGEL
jgi:hypothetical protein